MIDQSSLHFGLPSHRQLQISLVYRRHKSKQTKSKKKVPQVFGDPKLLGWNTLYMIKNIRVGVKETLVDLQQYILDLSILVLVHSRFGR